VYANHQQRPVHWIFKLTRNRRADWTAAFRRNLAGGELEPPADHPHDQHQHFAGREATDHGILFQTNRSWSIDDKRYNFQFGTEMGWEIKNGKRLRMLKNPSYSGITTEFWNSMDAICSRDEWTLWGTPNCGKGQPQQVMGTGHGAAPARFRKVKVGSAYS
jgi:PmbA/TldA metallopeptidase C-terminal domain